MEHQKEIKTNRLQSLDALRGFDMLWIIGGGKIIQELAHASNSGFLNALSNQFGHVPWEGFHFFDLIMSLFLFMAGMSIPFSVNKRLSLGESKKKIYLHAFKRSIILIILGMMYEGNLLAFDINNFYIGSVLGSIGLGYFFSVLIYTQLNIKNQIWLVSVLLVIYWLILTFIPVPGQQASVLLPELNIVKYVEHLVFGRFAKPNVTYMWFLPTLGFISTVMTGVFASTIVRGNHRFSFVKSSNKQIHKTVFIVLIGLLLVVVSLLLNIRFPIIKRIWNPAFVLFTSGLSFFLFSLFYFIIDVKGYKRWAFWLKVIGMNSIAVYLGVHFIPFDEIANSLVFGLEQLLDSFYPAIRSLVGLIIIYIVLYWMYKKKTFIKV